MKAAWANDAARPIAISRASPRHAPTEPRAGLHKAEDQGEDQRHLSDFGDHVVLTPPPSAYGEGGAALVLPP